MSVSYEWYLMYEQDRKTYVLDRFQTHDGAAARKNHEHSCAFHWVTGEMTNPRVSALEAVDGRGRVAIREACQPGQDPKRIYKAVPPPPEVRAALASEQLGAPSATVEAPSRRPEAPSRRPEAPSRRPEAPPKDHPWDS